jgi:hypothetical protein
MGFAQSASFLEERARKARDPSDAQRFSEMATFYRQLANIIPDFSPGLSDAERRRARADECRAIASCLADPLSRDIMMRLADSYDPVGAAAEPSI